MTKEEIKIMITAQETLTKYGVIIKNGRCKSICHSGHNYTAKVSDQLYYCFKCSRYMDVFDITMHFNQCNFKTAMEILGSANSFTFNRKIYRERMGKVTQRKIIDKELKHILVYIGVYRLIVSKQKPFTDLWCYCVNKLQYQYYLFELHNEKR